ncbi:hypothetical protein ABZ863_07720 [Saccharomonospora sp. NPDC046836]|uniref:Imm32 family immunity protein n=1 Tax=Saccharomonospora sp. NPDC046836 TaxID=3156921 RepID=UPI0033C86E06
MIVTLCSEGPDTALSGSPEEYLAFADALTRSSGTIELDEEADVKPYEYALARIEVQENSTRDSVLINVNQEHNALVIEGPGDKLPALGNVVRDSATSGHPRGHVHVEYFPGHFYLGEGSVPIAIRDAQPKARCHRRCHVDLRDGVWSPVGPANGTGLRNDDAIGSSAAMTSEPSAIRSAHRGSYYWLNA